MIKIYQGKKIHSICDSLLSHHMYKEEKVGVWSSKGLFYYMWNDPKNFILNTDTAAVTYENDKPIGIVFNFGSDHILFKSGLRVAYDPWIKEGFLDCVLGAYVEPNRRNAGLASKMIKRIYKAQPLKLKIGADGKMISLIKNNAPLYIPIQLMKE